MTEPAAHPVVVTLYTKPGCHLCEPVAATIAAAAKVRAFESRTRNILDDPADLERFRQQVVTLRGILIAEEQMARHISDVYRQALE